LPEEFLSIPVPLNNEAKSRLRTRSALPRSKKFGVILHSIHNNKKQFFCRPLLSYFSIQKIQLFLSINLLLCHLLPTPPSTPPPTICCLPYCPCLQYYHHLSFKGIHDENWYHPFNISRKRWMHLQTDSGTSTFLCLDDEVWFGWILACHSKDQAGSAGVAESQAISQPHWNVLQFFLCTRNRCAHTMPPLLCLCIRIISCNHSHGNEFLHRDHYLVLSGLRRVKRLWSRNRTASRWVNVSGRRIACPCCNVGWWIFSWHVDLALKLLLAITSSSNAPVALLPWSRLSYPFNFTKSRNTIW